ncbi:hypothetical protein CL616_02020 [archaeon]|nr:hypothetical protein [archaeon]|tara:strand:+ start:792 stop:992 length:201 start_codon:yes stop_codon:yes gene_type:complete
MTKDIKTDIKNIVDKLTNDTNSVFSEKIYNLAADLGIGEILVKESLLELMDDNYICEPVMGIIKKI